MPTVKYYVQSVRGRGTATKETYVHCATAKIKNEKDLESITKKRGFIRFRTGGITIQECIARRKAEGRSDWYV